MADPQFVTKDNLVALIKGVIQKKETGLLSILTDTKRSVLLKFSEGVLIHSYCRTRDIGDVVQVINESALVKFNLVPIPPESGIEVMPGGVLLQLLEAGLEGGGSSKATPQAPANQRNAEVSSAGEILEKAAAEYVGLVAEVLVEEALDSCSTLDEAIDYIANAIPNPDQAAEFRAEVTTQTRLISG
jgi:hypothetical protein